VSICAPERLRIRTKRFALEAIQLCRKLPKSEEARLIGRQLIRAATSIAANYRAVGRARSRAEFIAKLGTVVEEADEAVFWIEMLLEAGVVPSPVVRKILSEANRLVAIFAASQRTARRRSRSPDHPMTRSPDSQ
jgi:four helix bundle protein